jgi:hypothetical protein
MRGLFLGWNEPKAHVTVVVDDDDDDDDPSEQMEQKGK